MENKFIKLFHEFNSRIELGMIKDIEAFFEERDDTKGYTLKVDEVEKILINIKLNKFSKWSAKKLFSEFICFIGYDEINLYLCDNVERQIKYLYLTAEAQNLDGIKMEIVIE